VAQLIGVDKNYFCGTVNFMKKPRREGRGRPQLPQGMARNETLRIRLTAKEKAAIEAQSGNPSEWARHRLLAGLLANGLPKAD